jgi:hypothetical protein
VSERSAEEPHVSPSMDAQIPSESGCYFRGGFWDKVQATQLAWEQRPVYFRRQEATANDEFSTNRRPYRFSRMFMVVV